MQKQGTVPHSSGSGVHATDHLTCLPTGQLQFWKNKTPGYHSPTEHLVHLIAHQFLTFTQTFSTIRLLGSDRPLHPTHELREPNLELFGYCLSAHVINMNTRASHSRKKFKGYLLQNNRIINVCFVHSIKSKLIYRSCFLASLCIYVDRLFLYELCYKLVLKKLLS